ncbi:MAG: hypothetical protein QNJ45_05855 [Ardenticatenaceae bacterium]|nr:hypothetical protein [Ardenticatenaceae bacterium]
MQRQLWQRHSRESGNPLDGYRWIPTVVYPREDGGQDDGLVWEDDSYGYLFIKDQYRVSVFAAATRPSRSSNTGQSS